MKKRWIALIAVSFATCTGYVCAQSQSSSSPSSTPLDSVTNPSLGQNPDCLSDSTASGDCLATGQSSVQSLDMYGAGSQLEYPGLSSSSGLSRGSVYRDDAGLLGRSNLGVQRRPTPPNKPQPLTEFQILVAGSVGRIVPNYGADLFANVPDTFAPVERIPVTPDYVIGPGDQLLIRVWGQVNQNLQLVVDRTGSVYVPQVGSIRVAGLPFAQLQDFLKSQFNRVYRNYDMNVNLGQLHSIQIFVTGEARRPGSYTVSSLSTLVNAVFACGGPASDGTLRHIQLRRAGKLVTDFDLYDLLLKGDKSKDAQLETGDVIYFAPIGPQIAIVGSVKMPAIYELHDAETVTDALALAGGLSAMADTSTLEIERTKVDASGKSARVAIEIAMDAAGHATRLDAADILRIPTRAPRFETTVILRGNVANPGRFAWHEGMRIHDLIPDQQSLLTPGYWLRREQLGLPTADYQPLLPPLPQTATTAREAGTPEASNRVRPQDAQTLSSGLFPQITAGAQSEAQIPSGASAQNTSLAGSTDTRLAAGAGANASAAALSAQSTTPAVLGSGPNLITTPHFPIETQVVRMSPDIDWSYAVVERVDQKTLTTRLIPFNLGAAVLNHDESADVPLEPGDAVTVFSDADIRVPRAQQTKYVRLEGEFVHAGVYSVLPGETLRQLVNRAGGLTNQAYLYGSQFSRESTRREQQQRLDEYVAALSYQIEISASNKSGSVVSPTEAATLGSSVASQRELVNRLREVRATGRIVLHLDPFKSSVDSLPDLPLEDGDRFVVPPMPSTVGIVGAVYDPNSFVYLPHSHVENYLHNSGGPNRNADRRQIFVIRADGSVVSRQYLGHSLWTNDSFDQQPIYPGDTIVVPENVNKTTFLRGLTDWSAVFSQFALGAAAIEVIK